MLGVLHKLHIFVCHSCISLCTSAVVQYVSFTLKSDRFWCNMLTCHVKVAINSRPEMPCFKGVVYSQYNRSVTLLVYAGQTVLPWSCENFDVFLCVWKHQNAVFMTFKNNVGWFHPYVFIHYQHKLSML